MNRLQKKCVLATAGVHLLLFVILLVGPAFFAPRPKADDLQVLDVIPANLIDAPFASGVRNAEPPPTGATRAPTTGAAACRQPATAETGTGTGGEARARQTDAGAGKIPGAQNSSRYSPRETQRAAKQLDPGQFYATSAGLAQGHPEFETEFFTEHHGGHAR